mmetsp:Transcript_19957/g.67109  ORF Transcript_19957/g.67109 Transcript_19957/m.67109 type:complete len:443 (+) Transcript_19957:97-1425(+)
MTNALCYATHSSACGFKPMRFSRHAPGDNDVCIAVKYCGVCHSDVHAAKNDFMRTVYPFVPGHEIAGTVTSVGKAVRNFKVGDNVGVGCFVDSCLDCRQCKRGDEQFCLKGMTGTYGSFPNHGRAGTEITKGGYSNMMVVHEHFVVKVPSSVPLEKAGPLLCAGITTYAPLVKHKVGQGSRVGVNGLGGLGTMAVKQAKAMGAEVTVISRSSRKADYAKQIGADHFVISADPASVQAQAASLDLVIDTVSSRHDIQPSLFAGSSSLLGLLDANGVWVYCGLILDMQDVQPMRLVVKQNAVTGTLIGGMALLQECLDFCGKHRVLPETKTVPVWEVNQVFELLDAGNDSGLRYVLDIESTLNEACFDRPAEKPPRLHSGKSRTLASLAFIASRAMLAKVEGAVLDRPLMALAVGAATCAFAVAGVMATANGARTVTSQAFAGY